MAIPPKTTPLQVNPSDDFSSGIADIKADLLHPPKPEHLIPPIWLNSAGYGAAHTGQPITLVRTKRREPISHKKSKAQRQQEFLEALRWHRYLFSLEAVKTKPDRQAIHEP